MIKQKEYFCCLDFEATCWKKRAEHENKKNRSEIIEFPSILYFYDGQEIKFLEEFHEYVKPVFYPKLTEFCTELTGITQETVNKADIFPNVFARHHNWLKKHILVNGDYPLSFVTCGAWDINTQLSRELKNKNISRPNLYNLYINLKEESRYFYNRSVTNMNDILENAELNFEGRQHSGIDDTRNIARAFEKLLKDGHTKFQYNNA